MYKIIGKYKTLSVQAKSMVWFAICSIIQKGISFFTVPIFTRLLTPEQYGTYSLYLSWLQILTIITSLYLYQGVFNNGMTKFDEDRDAYISSMQGLTLIITAIVFGIYMIARNYWSEFLGLAPVFMILMFTEMLLTPSLSFWTGRQRFEFKYKRLVIIALAKSLANPVLGVIMVLLMPQRDLARISSVVITEAIFCVPIMITQYANGKSYINLKYWKYALRLAIPLIPHYLSGMILNQGDRVMIDRMVGKSEVAFYSVAYNIGMLVQIVTQAISNSFTPWMYQKIKKSDYIGIKQTINILLVIIAFVGIALMLCSPELVIIFGSKEYKSAAYVIAPVAASVYFIFLYNIIAIPQFYFEKTKFLALSSIVVAAVNILLNYIFIKLFGYVAAGYTTLICYVLYSLGHYIVSKRVLRANLSNYILFDKKFIIVLSLTVIGIGIGCNFLFRFWLIRYVLLVLLAVCAFKMRHKLRALINSLKA